MMAYVTAVPSLERLGLRYARWLKVSGKSTLSYALCRDSSLRMAQSLLDHLNRGVAPKRGELVALDSMPLTLPATRQHHCKRINRRSVGGAILWAFRLQAPRGVNPVTILNVIRGPWHDTQTIRDAPLTPKGPIYLMDRGFWSIPRIVHWLGANIHFIVRVKKQDFKYTRLKRCGRARGASHGVHIQYDGVAQLGGPHRKTKPTVRLVVARLADGKDLILASDRMAWSAEKILAAYKRRWEIERFHRLLKETMGLAHLYSFHETGIFFLAHVAFLLAALLYISASNARGATIDVLKMALDACRRSLGLATRWKRNTSTRPKSKKGKRKRKKAKNH